METVFLPRPKTGQQESLRLKWITYKNKRVRKKEETRDVQKMNEFLLNDIKRLKEGKVPDIC